MPFTEAILIGTFSHMCDLIEKEARSVKLNNRARRNVTQIMVAFLLILASTPVLSISPPRPPSPVASPAVGAQLDSKILRDYFPPAISLQGRSLLFSVNVGTISLKDKSTQSAMTIVEVVDGTNIKVTPLTDTSNVQLQDWLTASTSDFISLMSWGNTPPKKLEALEYRVAGEESLTLAVGTYQAIKLKRVLNGIQSVVWCTPTLGPIRYMESSTKGQETKVTSIVLEKIKLDEQGNDQSNMYAAEHRIHIEVNPRWHESANDYATSRPIGGSIP